MGVQFKSAVPVLAQFYAKVNQTVKIHNTHESLCCTVQDAAEAF